MSTLIESIARLGILGFVAVAFALLFAFVVVASLLDVPGLREVPAETQQNFFTVLTTIVAGLGGAAAALFQTKKDA